MPTTRGAALFDLSGQRALVTGSGQGLGFAIARGLGRAGAAVILNGRDQGKLAAAKAELEGEGIAVTTCAFDVTDGAAVIEAVAAIGPLDILVNNAGVQRRGPLETISDEDWQTVIDVNLTSVFRVARAVVPGMIARKRGKIINLASVASLIVRPTIGPYAASKGAVQLLTRSMAVEWSKHNIQVNALAPGYFSTPLNESLKTRPGFDDWVRTRTPAGRWAEPEELEGAAVFLASRASDFVSGHMLVVDGGLSVALL